jgi:hypothetical protein
VFRMALTVSSSLHLAAKVPSVVFKPVPTRLLTSHRIIETNAQRKTCYESKSFLCTNISAGLLDEPEMRIGVTIRRRGQ